MSLYDYVTIKLDDIQSHEVLVYETKRMYEVLIMYNDSPELIKALDLVLEHILSPARYKEYKAELKEKTK